MKKNNVTRNFHQIVSEIQEFSFEKLLSLCVVFVYFFPIKLAMGDTIFVKFLRKLNISFKKMFLNIVVLKTL